MTCSNLDMVIKVHLQNINLLLHLVREIWYLLYKFQKHITISNCTGILQMTRHLERIMFKSANVLKKKLFDFIMEYHTPMQWFYVHDLTFWFICSEFFSTVIWLFYQPLFINIETRFCQLTQMHCQIQVHNLPLIAVLWKKNSIYNF